MGRAVGGLAVRLWRSVASRPLGAVSVASGGLSLAALCLCPSVALCGLSRGLSVPLWYVDIPRGQIARKIGLYALFSRFLSRSLLAAVRRYLKRRRRLALALSVSVCRSGFRSVVSVKLTSQTQTAAAVTIWGALWAGEGDAGGSAVRLSVSLWLSLNLGLSLHHTRAAVSVPRWAGLAVPLSGSRRVVLSLTGARLVCPHINELWRPLSLCGSLSAYCAAGG